MRRNHLLWMVAMVMVLEVWLLAGCHVNQTESTYEGEKKESSKQEISYLKDSEAAEESALSNEESSQAELTEHAGLSALKVTNGRLTDAEGKNMQLRGVSTHGLAWFPEYVNEECFRQLHDEWHANVVRLAMYTEEYGGYCSGGDQEALKALIQKGVDCAAAANLYVVIDWHILSDGNPQQHLEEAKQFFAEMAEQYADDPHVLYEICNEPNGNVSWAEIKAYAEEVIPVIRAYDSEAIVIVGTPNWSQYVDEAAADPIIGDEQIMYALHFYAATHGEQLRSVMTSAANAGLPIFVTEYGICDASGSGAIDEEQAARWIEAMDACGVSYVAWNLSNKEETSAMIRSDCSKVSGFTEENLSPSGKWVYQMLQQAAEK